MPRNQIVSTPKYRKHRASGQAIVTLNGRDVYLGPFGTAASRIEYDRVIAEWLTHGRVLDPKGNGHDMTVVELIARYRGFTENHYKESISEVEKFKLAAKPLLALYGRSLAAEFGPRKLETVRQSMMDAGLSLRTINQRVERLKRMFRWAVKNEFVPADIWHGLQAVEGLRRGQQGVRPPKIVTPVADEIVEQTIPHLLPPVKAMVRLQLLTGMRSGEVVRMRGRDFEMSSEVWLYRPGRHKTAHRGHSREIRIGPRAKAVLEPFLKADLEQFLFQPRDAMAFRYERIRKGRKSKVQPSQISRKKRRPERQPQDQYTVATYRRAITRACDRAFPPPEGLLQSKKESHEQWMARLTPKQKQELAEWRKAHRWHPHQLRHNAATRLRKEFGIEAARVVLGHRSAAITEVYAEVDHAKAAEIMARVG